MDLATKIRQVPDWPKPGILFYDITTLFEDKEAFKYVVDKLVNHFKDRAVAKVVGIDARGFLLAAVVAYQLGAGLSIVRKKGKLPYKTLARDYDLEYGSNTIEMHEDTIKPGEKVLVIDDLIATGGTVEATLELIKEMRGELVGIGVVIDLPFLGGSMRLRKQTEVYHLVEYQR